MPITATAGEILDTDTDNTVFSTSSNSITSGDLIIGFFSSEGGTGADTEVPTVTGTNGFDVTYTEVERFDDIAAGEGVRDMWVVRGVAGSSTSGTMTWTFSDNRTSNITWGFFTLQTVNQATNQGVVQSAADWRGAGDGGFGTTGGTITLSAFADAANATVGIFCNNTTDAGEAGAGFAAVETHNGTTASTLVEFRNDNDTTVSAFSWGSTQRANGVALEIDGTAAGFIDAVIAEGVGTDDIAVPLDVDTHDDVNTDHSDLWRHTSSPATDGSIIQDDITPSESDTIIDNDANSTSAPAADTVHFYILRDWEEVGESTSHDSNEISIKTAPDRPTSLQAVG